MRRSLSVSAIAVVVFAVAGCVPPEDITKKLDVTCDEGAPRVTGADFIAQVVTPVCADCHNATLNRPTTPTFETLDALYANIVGQTSQRYGAQGLKDVDPGNLANSALWIKVKGGSPTYVGPHGESAGARMPLGKDALSDEKIALIKNWICGGAPRT